MARPTNSPYDPSLWRPMDRPIRQFDTGATRDTAENKPEYFGYLSWRAIRRFGAYMLKHQTQANGQKREADNWKKGIPVPVYEQSLTRHFQEWAEILEQQKENAGEGFARDVAMEAALAMLFNLQGWIHEVDKQAQKGEAQKEWAHAAAKGPIFLRPNGVEQKVEDLTLRQNPTQKATEIDPYYEH